MKNFDKQFIQQCTNGNRKAQKQLFEILYAPMFRVCMRYVVQHADAEDCLMRGFMKVFQNIVKFNYTGDHSLFIWIRKIMVNEALMFIRQRNNLMFIIDDEGIDIPLPAEMISVMEAEELNHHIMQLPTGYRMVFNLNVVEGYDHKEIANMLGITESTSRTQLAKAKNKLRILITQTSQRYGQAN